MVSGSVTGLDNFFDLRKLIIFKFTTWVMTPISRVKQPQLPIYKAICRGPIAPFTTGKGRPCMTPESRCQSLPFVVTRLGISVWKASLDCSKMFHPPWNKQQKHLQIWPHPKRKGNDQIVFQPSICSGFLRLVSRRVRVYCHPLKEANEQWSCFKIYVLWNCLQPCIQNAFERSHWECGEMFHFHQTLPSLKLIAKTPQNWCLEDESSFPCAKVGLCSAALGSRNSGDVYMAQCYKLDPFSPTLPSNSQHHFFLFKTQLLGRFGISIDLHLPLQLGYGTRPQSVLQTFWAKVSGNVLRLS